MSCFVSGDIVSPRKVRPNCWMAFACMALLWGSSQSLFAQSALLEEPIGEPPLLTPVQNEVGTDNGVTVPALDPKTVFATQDDLFRQNQRIMELEQRLSDVQTETQKGLQEGRLRSTDIPLIENLRKQPAFPKVRLTGFFQADAGFFNQDPTSIAAYGDINDNRGFRRTRLAAVGDVSEYVSYMIEMDFAFPGRPSFMDVWADVHDVPVLGNVRIGQYRMPFGMDALTSVRELTFLERASPFAFNPFRQIGAGFHDNNEAQTVTWAASVYGTATDPWGGNTGDNGYGMASRITALPIYADDGSFLVHVGFDYSLNRPSSKTIEYRNTPEYGGPFVGPTGTLASVPFFVDTGVMSATTSNLLNAEAAAVWNHAYVQSELTYALVNLTNGNTATFPGYYAQAGYFLTGEQRSYNKIAGVLGRVKPIHNWGEPCGYGAVELAARYSYLDLTSRSVSGGRMNDVTLGVNWYLNQYTKLQLNYIRSIVDQTSTGVNNIDTNIVALRAQLDF